MVSSSDGRVMQTLVQGFRVLQAFTASEPALTLGQVAYRTGLDSGDCVPPCPDPSNARLC